MAMRWLGTGAAPRVRCDQVLVLDLPPSSGWGGGGGDNTAALSCFESTNAGLTCGARLVLLTYVLLSWVGVLCADGGRVVLHRWPPASHDMPQQPPPNRGQYVLLLCGLTLFLPPASHLPMMINHSRFHAPSSAWALLWSNCLVLAGLQVAIARALSCPHHRAGDLRKNSFCNGWRVVHPQALKTQPRCPGHGSTPPCPGPRAPGPCLPRPGTAMPSA